MTEPDDFEIDTSVVSVARSYDYFLGGTDNYAVDRMASDMAEDADPGTFALTRNNRRFLERTVRYLAAECGIRQFIDHGSGLPTRNNVHQIAQSVAPDSRVVYIELDPVVIAHGKVKALTEEGGNTAFIHADATDVEKVLGHPETRRLIDFDEPVAALYFSFFHNIPDSRDPQGVMRKLLDRAVPGSYLAMSHLCSPDAEFRQKKTDYTLRVTGGNWGRVRSPEEIEAYFEGLEVVPPGVVHVNEWHPDGREEDQNPNWYEYGGVARKP